MEAQVINKINYHTNQLKRSFRLNSHDTEDVRQDLTLKALEAERAYNPESAASLTTFVKIAVENKAADIFCKLKIQPIMDNREKCGGIEGAGVRNHNFQRTAEIMDELNDASHAPATEIKKIKIKPTVSSIGVNLQHITEAKPENTPEAKMDVQAALATLTPRQRKICKMLMNGHTLEETAKSMGVKKQSIHAAVKKLQPIFEKTILRD